jgi:hypothetical protein
MATPDEDITHWTARVAELERQLDAATKLADVKAIAGGAASHQGGAQEGEG